MTRSTVVANRRVYTVSGLEPRARGQIFQAVVMAQLVDGLTGAPVAGGRVSTSFPGLSPLAASGGFVGLAGAPSRAMPALAATAYAVDVLVEADDFAPRRDLATFAAQPGFPAIFTPADLGALVIRRRPTVMSVSTYELDASGQPVPVAGATVTVTGSWPSVDRLASAATATPLLAVAAGLYARRPPGATVDAPAFTMPAEPGRTLTSAVAPGATRLPVSATGALTAGDLVALDLADPERAERVAVIAVHGPADKLSPAELELAFPLAHAHADGAAAARLLVSGGAASLAVTAAEGLAGDRTLPVTTLVGVSAGQVLRISGGTSAPEYQVADRYEFTTDGDGFGRFPPVTGLAAVAISAASGGLSASTRVNLTQPAPAVHVTLT